MSDRDVDFWLVTIKPVNAIVARFLALNAQGQISQLAKIQLEKLANKLFRKV